MVLQDKAKTRQVAFEDTATKYVSKMNMTISYCPSKASSVIFKSQRTIKMLRQFTQFQCFGEYIIQIPKNSCIEHTHYKWLDAKATAKVTWFLSSRSGTLSVNNAQLLPATVKHQTHKMQRFKQSTHFKLIQHCCKLWKEQSYGVSKDTVK